ncbi:MAG: diacylglycerol kinase family protein [Bacteroidales bacterium]|nr:diacylglycerol kinase family protein [Bacteroidales bacterium]MDE7465158.1 diacylglycerol kinase family protein [Muribaculaceae bacterium]
MGYWNKRKKAFGYAFQGIAELFKKESHAQIDFIATVCVILAGLLLNLERWEWCAIIVCIGGVLMGEGMNTAIERLCDRVSMERHPLIKAAKDIAAGAVLLFVIAAIIVGSLIFIPHIISLFVEIN